MCYRLSMDERNIQIMARQVIKLYGDEALKHAVDCIEESLDQDSEALTEIWTRLFDVIAALQTEAPQRVRN